MFNSFPRPIPDKNSGSNIRSIQRGVVKLTAAILTANVPISKIDPSRAVLLLSSTGDSGTNGVQTIETRGVITDAATLTFTRGSHNNDVVEISWQVIEFISVKSKQTGQYSLTPTAGNAEKLITISSIDTTKSMMFASSTVPSGSNAQNTWLQYRIVNSNTIAVRINGDSPGAVASTIEWQVIEFF